MSTFNETRRPVDWGSEYGPGPHYFTVPTGPLWMHRKGQKVRYYNIIGEQVGPDLSNVAPAICYAMDHHWGAIFP